MTQEELWQQQIKKAVKGNSIIFGSNRELRRLPEHLHEGEEVLSIITGSRADKRGRGLVVATNERLFFLWDGWVFRENNDLPYTALNSIEFKTKIFFGVVEAFAAGDSIAYNWVGRFAGKKFVRLVRQLTAEANRNLTFPGRYQQQQGYTPPVTTPQPLPTVDNPVPSVTPSIPTNQPLPVIPAPPPLPLAPPPIQHNNPVVVNPETEGNVAFQLTQLKKLFDSDIISEEEYEQKRQELIARL